MPTKVIKFEDATITVHVPAFGGEIKIDIACEDKGIVGLTTDQFGAIVYPAIKAWATTLPEAT